MIQKTSSKDQLGYDGKRLCWAQVIAELSAEIEWFTVGASRAMDVHVSYTFEGKMLSVVHIRVAFS